MVRGVCFAVCRVCGVWCTGKTGHGGGTHKGGTTKARGVIMLFANI